MLTIRPKCWTPVHKELVQLKAFHLHPDHLLRTTKLHTFLCFCSKLLQNVMHDVCALLLK
jgi:hypothetical protein